jgi:anti-anti-sigma factor
MKVQKIHDVTIISADERLDAGMTPKLKSVVKELAQETGIKLVIDLGNVRLIDSSGCGELVAALKTVSKNHGDMKIARPTPQASALIQLTGLHRILDIHDTLEGALSSFGLP